MRINKCIAKKHFDEYWCGGTTGFWYAKLTVCYIIINANTSFFPDDMANEILQIIVAMKYHKRPTKMYDTHFAFALLKRKSSRF